MTQLREFTAAYIECALWASSDEEGSYEGRLRAEACVTQMHEDCESFMRKNAGLLGDAFLLESVEYTPARAGHDFWLTRNHHGAGFWYRGLGELGDRLTKAAHEFGPAELYAGDDGLIY